MNFFLGEGIMKKTAQKREKEGGGRSSKKPSKKSMGN